MSVQLIIIDSNVDILCHSIGIRNLMHIETFQLEKSLLGSVEWI